MGWQFGGTGLGSLLLVAFLIPFLRRLTLIIALSLCLGHNFFLENPGSSVIGYYRRLVWLFRELKKKGTPAARLQKETTCCYRTINRTWATRCICFRCLYRSSGWPIGAIQHPNAVFFGRCRLLCASSTRASLRGISVPNFPRQRFTMTAVERRDMLAHQT